jgi:hypothetical protein
MGGKNPQSLTPEERAEMMPKIQAAIAAAMKEAGVKPGAAAGGQGGERQAGRGQDATSQGGQNGQSPRVLQFAGGPGGGQGGQGGEGMTGGPGGRPMGMAGASRYSEKELADAKLPPPPEEDTQFDVLLRPGLLADVEIIVEHIPNAINVPMQAVFEREGKPVVYVKNGNVFEPRVIKLFKRSESVMVISEGLKPGEIVALADPTAKRGEAKKEKKGDSGAMSALPGGGK